MASPFIIDDKDLDDAALWAVIDSAAAASLSSSTKSTISKPRNKPLTPIPFPLPSPQPKNPRNHYQNPNGEAMQNHRPQKISRSSNSSCVSELSESSPSPLAVVKHVHRMPTTPPPYSSNSPVTNHSINNGSYGTNGSGCKAMSYGYGEGGEMRHSLYGQFPTVNLFKEYQNAAMAILEKSDYIMISGNPFIKKSGWRKISFYFNLSYEIKDKTIEFDQNRNVQRAEFVVRAYMQGGRFSDGWGSCERREKRFLKPNHDIPSTAETRAKNKSCQDLLGIGEYRPGASHANP
ncbi:uncharacterized protein LOC111388948 [Olea europaea var. sylvestris]|uniref:uncharacterized protein LOC111388948 n=1 Tax=Olea europaea var. sylvestris TaxID=158386 RepID=UPI000C1D8CDB|nr:uncharacterized protein LOC111388948 [Olea europaea var. sylvestris]